MNLNKSLYKVEKNWLNELFDASTACFKGVKLPSHDHWHHYRVWIYAKELVKARSPGFDFTCNQLTNLLVAAFFTIQAWLLLNAETRFKNFKSNFRNCKNLVNRHDKRLKILLDFYNNIPYKEYNRNIIEQVNINIKQNKPQNLSDLVANEKQKDEFKSFKNEFARELNSFANP